MGKVAIDSYKMSCSSVSMLTHPEIKGNALEISALMSAMRDVGDRMYKVTSNS